jgi:subtilisin family serine protease
MRRELTLTSIFILMLSCLNLAIASSALAAKERVIIGYTSPPGRSDEDDIAAKGGKVKHRYHIIPAIAAEIDEAEVGKIKKQSKVKYVEPDYEVHIAETIPNDLNPNLWGLNNTGQTGGTPDADIDAPQAWDIQTGSSDVVIAVIDTGVDYNHVDLAANMWTNPGEIPGNGVDDDGNGYVDDVHGYDFYNYDSDPMDDNSHGTHCSGTIAAVGNNGVGVVGVNWTANIMALKFLSAIGSGSLSDAVIAIEYAIAAKQDGVPVVAMSNSWGSGDYSESLEDAIIAANNAGILFIAAAGNNSRNIDGIPFYPASYDVPNIISIAATDHNDNLANFSNYGPVSVDLAAPGVNILSAVPGDIYGYKSGTSMATPHVSGVAGLIKAQFPGLTYMEIKNRILISVDFKDNLAGKMLAEGRLNARNALNGIPSQPVPPTGLVATTGSVRVDLDWDDNSEPELTGYKVYRSTRTGGPYSLIDTATDSQYIDINVDGATTYYYVVTAVCDFVIESEYSNEANAITSPEAPASLIAVAGDGQITLDWDDNAGSVEYRIYRSTIPGGSYDRIASGVLVSEYTDLGVLNGITYYYIVTALGTLTDEESEPSNEASATPVEVTSRTLYVTNSSLVRYSDDTWHQLAPGQYTNFHFESFSVPEGRVLTSVIIYVEHWEEDGFSGNIEWTVKGVCKSDVSLHTIELTDSWDVTDIVSNSDLLDLCLTIHNNGTLQKRTSTDYIYAQIEWGVTEDTPPAKVTGLGVTTSSSSSLNLSWDANTEPDLSHYNVCRSSASGGPYSLIASPATNSYLDTGLEPSTTYYYVVSAEDTMEAEGPMSDEASGTTAAPENTPPAKVTGLEVTTASSSSLKLTWNANSEPDLSHYNVYRSNTSGGPYSLIASPATNSYLDTGLEPSTTYYYVVSAEDTLEAEGPMSNEASGTTSMPVDTIMYVESITFSSKVAGKNKFLYIDVKVVDGNAKPLSDAEVNMLLVRDGDGGRPWYFSDDTEYNGIVRFTRRKADVGRYTATVTDLYLSVRTWDSNKGVTSDSCELQSDGTVIQGTALTPALASSMLLQNNPNPFNPETWIPYVLAKPERVIIRIYDTTGRLVKTLDLGDRAAGAYISKEKAVYWDGTNEHGENVSSGVYFYIMEAGPFRAAERMVIIR